MILCRPGDKAIAHVVRLYSRIIVSAWRCRAIHDCWQWPSRHNSHWLVVARLQLLTADDLVSDCLSILGVRNTRFEAFLITQVKSQIIANIYSSCATFVVQYWSISGRAEIGDQFQMIYFVSITTTADAFPHFQPRFIFNRNSTLSTLVTYSVVTEWPYSTERVGYQTQWNTYGVASKVPTTGVIGSHQFSTSFVTSCEAWHLTSKIGELAVSIFVGTPAEILIQLDWRNAGIIESAYLWHTNAGTW